MVCEYNFWNYFSSKQLIKDAIMDNAFLKNLDTSQIREIVDAMEPKEFPAGSYIIRQGHAGVHLFVSAEGDFEVLQDDKILGHMEPGKAFGELAILYNCTRTASIRGENIRILLLVFFWKTHFKTMKVRHFMSG